MPGSAGQDFREAEVLRALGGSEQYLWKAAQAGSRNFSIVVSFSGVQDEAAWKAAFRRVQARHPLLNAAIRSGGEAQKTPVFTKGTGEPIPLRRDRRASTSAWRDEAARELITPFEATDAPLLRAVLLEDEDGCDLILTALHSIGDGLSLLTVLSDLLAALAGEALTRLPLPASIEERFFPLSKHAEAPEPSGAEQVSAENGRQPARVFEYRGVRESPHMDALRLPEALTSQIIRAARAEHVTVGAALLTALGFASRELSSTLRKAEIQVLFPVDARSLVGNQGELSYAVGGGRAAMPYPAAAFWDTARLLRGQLQASQTAEALGATLAQMGGLVAMDLDAPVLAASLAQVGFDSYLSNLRTAEFPKVPQNLKVEALWGTGLILGLEGEQNIGAVTLRGALHLLNTSYTPMNGLLAAVRRILEDESAARGGPATSLGAVP